MQKTNRKETDAVSALFIRVSHVLLTTMPFHFLSFFRWRKHGITSQTISACVLHCNRKKCKSTFAIGNVHVRIFPLMQKNQTKPNRTKHKNISTTTLATNAIFTFAFFRIGDTSSLGDNLWNLSTSFILYFMDEFCWSSIFVICCGFFLSFFGFYSFVCDVCVCLLIFV